MGSGTATSWRWDPSGSNTATRPFSASATQTEPSAATFRPSAPPSKSTKVPHCADLSAGGDIVDAHDVTAGVGVIEASAVGGEAKAVGQHHAAGDGAHRAVEVDDVQASRLRLVAAENPERQRADPYAAVGVGGQVVEADPACVRGREQDLPFPVCERRPGDVAAAEHEATLLMQGDAADAAASGEHGRDLASAVQQMDAAIAHIAEVETLGGVPHRPLDQPVARDHFLHRPTLPLCVLSPFWGEYGRRPGGGPLLGEVSPS